MLSRQEYNIKKSLLKRKYREAILAQDANAAAASNPYVRDYVQRAEARNMLRGRGLYDGPMAVRS